MGNKNLSTSARAHDEEKSQGFLRRRRYGLFGTGFWASIAVHLALLIAVICCSFSSRHVDSLSGVFVGSGGGSAGEVQQRMRENRKSEVRLMQKIVTKKLSPVALPVPQPVVHPAVFDIALLKRGGIRGLGKGATGGGFGDGAPGAQGLSGSFYDCKQGPLNLATSYVDVDSRYRFISDVLVPFTEDFDQIFLDRRFFCAPIRLKASRIYITHRPAADGPSAYGLGNLVKPQRWIACYRGCVRAPVSGRFRFWGLGDDALVVRWDKRRVLDAGWETVDNYRRFDAAGVPTPVTARMAGRFDVPFKAGPWIDVEQGRSYEIEIMLSEIPGGWVGAWLMMEQSTLPGGDKGDGHIFLFQTCPASHTEELMDDTGLGVDMTGKGLSWSVVSP